MNANKNLCGKRVKMARIDMEMTQIDLSAALSVDLGMEISQKALSRLEKGQRLVRDIELVALGKILEVSIEWLVMGGTAKK
jgi:transcriptional regulator with XRE-family HTH domain